MKERRERSRGAVTVELALLAPIFLILVALIIDFGYRYMRAAQYNNAASVAVRNATLAEHTVGDATAAGSAALPTLDGSEASGTLVTTTAQCAAGSTAIITWTYTQTLKYKFPLPVLPSTYTVTGQGKAQCPG